MPIRFIVKILWLTSLLFCCFLPAEASLWPGLGTQAKEKSGAFRTDDYHIESTLLQSPWLIARGNNEEYAGKVNAAIAREKKSSLLYWKKKMPNAKLGAVWDGMKAWLEISLPTNRD